MTVVINFKPVKHGRKRIGKDNKKRFITCVSNSSPLKSSIQVAGEIMDVSIAKAFASDSTADRQETPGRELKYVWLT
jgi:hypothetical protein